MWTLITLVATLIGVVYLYMRNSLNYWKKKGVPYSNPTIIFGNMLESIMMTRHAGDIITEIYRKYKDYKYVGFYKMMYPAIIVRDPELIKAVLVTDFFYFEANDIEIDEEYDIIAGKNVFVLQGHKWKTVRGKITPTLTSNKLKLMYPLMNEVGEKLITYLNGLLDAGNAKCVDAKELMVKFTTENVASCAFGLNGDAFKEEDSEFVKRSKEIGKVSLFGGIKILIITLAPSLSKIFKVKFFNDYVSDYLTSIVSQTIKYRQENNIVRHDFLDMMIQLKQKHADFTDVDAVAQAAGFFADGVETSASVMSYIMYELGKNQEVQKKLQKDIDEIIKKYGQINYDNIQELTYLDCIIDETIRCNPPALAFFKKCTKNYKMPSPKQGINDIVIEKGTGVIIPVEALHYDPKYFKDPEIFKPERFNDQNKDQIVKYTYLPFGDGPRICLGKRFGVMQLKVATVSLFANFNVKLNKKTPSKLLVHPAGLVRTPVGGIWIDIFKRI